MKLPKTCPFTTNSTETINHCKREVNLQFLNQLSLKDCSLARRAYPLAYRAYKQRARQRVRALPPDVVSGTSLPFSPLRRIRTDSPAILIMVKETF